MLKNTHFIDYGLKNTPFFGVCQFSLFGMSLFGKKPLYHLAKLVNGSFEADQKGLVIIKSFSSGI